MVSVAFCCLYKVELKELGSGRQQSWVTICIGLSMTVASSKFHSGPQFPTKQRKPARSGFPPGVIKCDHGFEGIC